MSSYGVLRGSSLAVKYRGNETPVRLLAFVLVFNVSIFALRSTESCPMVICFPPCRALVILPQGIVLCQEIYLYAVSRGYDGMNCRLMFRRVKEYLRVGE